MCGPLLRRFLGRHLMLCLGLGIVLVMSLAALGAPLLAPYDPNALHLDHILEPPSSMFWLGTDRLGRDVFSRLLYGGRISLWVGFVAVGISVSIGTGLGLISGYFGGLVDEGIMRGVDIMLCFPSFFLILSVIAFLEPSLTNIMIVIGLTSWMGVARLVRAETLSLRQRDFVSAARLSGCSTCRIAAPYPAQHTGPCAHFRHAGRGRRHPGGIRAQFSRTWRPAAHGQLGEHAHGGQDRSGRCPLAFLLSGCRHPGDRAGLQPSG